jgi:fucose permease
VRTFKARRNGRAFFCAYGSPIILCIAVLRAKLVASKTRCINPVLGGIVGGAILRLVAGPVAQNVPETRTSAATKMVANATMSVWFQCPYQKCIQNND